MNTHSLYYCLGHIDACHACSITWIDFKHKIIWVLYTGGRAAVATPLFKKGGRAPPPSHPPLLYNSFLIIILVAKNTAYGCLRMPQNAPQTRAPKSQNFLEKHACSDQPLYQLCI